LFHFVFLSYSSSSTTHPSLPILFLLHHSPPSSPSSSHPLISILPELTERADEIRQSLLAVPALADPQVPHTALSLSAQKCAQAVAYGFADFFDLREQKLQEFLSNAAKADGQAGAGQGERSDVTVAALLGGVKRRGDVADEGSA
jgi:hypothetical protein